MTLTVLPLVGLAIYAILLGYQHRTPEPPRHLAMFDASAHAAVPVRPAQPGFQPPRDFNWQAALVAMKSR